MSLFSWRWLVGYWVSFFKRTQWSIWVGVLFLILMVSLTQWLGRQTQSESSWQSGAGGPDYWAHNLQLWHLNAEGVQDYRVFTSFMEHYPSDGRFLLQKATLWYQHSPDRNSRLTAKQGIFMPQKDMIHLIGPVHGVLKETINLPTLKLQETVFITEWLDVFPKAEIATTQAPIQLSQNNTTMTGLGMLLDYRNNRFSLHRKVQVDYLPPSK